ncbi:hypothetical protein FRZ44_08720 [Hypericibacter terrae]|uniref:Uncharacterized protein n=1 Tax=Hypericibacter terrae TaxID=2602015 RepID=A0A5J6MGJ3_9PROT|nr:hypothetical protein [Hypericibacter terrae]QEX15585.1 hypothetical protein FRZ44_08720 [Hypericibacter terrae]
MSTSESKIPGGAPPQKGDRYVVLSEFEAGVLTHWLAPYTGGSSRSLPVGLEFVILMEPPSQATAVGAKPDPYERWETVLLEEGDRGAEKYGGYSLSISLSDLKAHCARR